MLQVSNSWTVHLPPPLTGCSSTIEKEARWERLPFSRLYLSPANQYFSGRRNGQSTRWTLKEYLTSGLLSDVGLTAQQL